MGHIYLRANQAYQSILTSSCNSKYTLGFYILQFRHDIFILMRDHPCDRQTQQKIQIRDLQILIAYQLLQMQPLALFLREYIKCPLPFVNRTSVLESDHSTRRRNQGYSIRLCSEKLEPPYLLFIDQCLLNRRREVLLNCGNHDSCTIHIIPLFHFREIRAFLELYDHYDFSLAFGAHQHKFCDHQVLSIVSSRTGNHIGSPSF